MCVCIGTQCLCCFLTVSHSQSTVGSVFFPPMFSFYSHEYYARSTASILLLISSNVETFSKCVHIVSGISLKLLIISDIPKRIADGFVFWQFTWSWDKQCVCLLHAELQNAHRCAYWIDKMRGKIFAQNMPKTESGNCSLFTFSLYIDFCFDFDFFFLLAFCHLLSFGIFFWYEMLLCRNTYIHKHKRKFLYQNAHTHLHIQQRNEYI